MERGECSSRNETMTPINFAFPFFSLINITTTIAPFVLPCQLAEVIVRMRTISLVIFALLAVGAVSVFAEAETNTDSSAELFGLNDDNSVPMLGESFLEMTSKQEEQLSSIKRRVYWRAQAHHYLRLSGLPLNLLATNEAAENKAPTTGYAQMEPIMKKVDELEKNIKEKQAVADSALVATKKACVDNQKRIDDNGARVQANIDSGNLSIKTSKETIAKFQAIITDSMKVSAGYNDTITKIFSDRKFLDDAYQARKVARLAEIATMRKANVLVCTFDNYVNTSFCKDVKSNTFDIAQPNATPGNALSDLINKEQAVTSSMQDAWNKEKAANDAAIAKGLVKPVMADLSTQFDSAESLLATRQRLKLDVMSMLSLGSIVSPEVRGMLTKTINLASTTTSAEVDDALPKLMTELIQRLVTEQTRETLDYMEAMRNFHAKYEETIQSQQLETNRRAEAQNQINSAQSAINFNNKTIILSQRELVDNALSKASEVERCADEIITYNSQSEARAGSIRNMDKLRSMLRVLKDSTLPKCANDCTSVTAGKCIYQGMLGADSYCACNSGYYSTSCEKVACKGRVAGVLYQSTDAAACNGTTAGACQNDGTCKCNTGYYGDACQFMKCPGTIECSNQGTCNTSTGVCQCFSRFSGSDCSNLRCAQNSRNDIFFDFDSPLVCNSGGTCDPKTGACTCNATFTGTFCQYRTCPKDCNGKGVCNTATGVCQCNAASAGEDCSLFTCPNNCSGGNGICNNLTGICYCHQGGSGVSCATSQQCSSTRFNANWWRSFDSEGWSVCPDGFLLTGLYRNDCNALYCIEEAQCSRPCEESAPVALADCYEADWVRSFDSEGWSQCANNYYVAGFLRSSCQSLYCLEKAKCCSITRGNWSDCKTMRWNFTQRGWFTVSGTGFVTGLLRSASQDLTGITSSSECSFRRPSDPKMY